MKIADIAKKKQYQPTQVAVMPIEPFTLMIPGTGPIDPGASPAPKHWRPGPGPSYDPQGSVV